MFQRWIINLHCNSFISAVFLWAETVNTIMSRSVRGLGLNAQCASGSVHTLLYIDGAAHLCQPGRALWESHAAGLNRRCEITPADDGKPGHSLHVRCAYRRAAWGTFTPQLKECAVSLTRSSKVTLRGQFRCWSLCCEVYAANLQSLAVMKVLTWMNDAAAAEQVSQADIFTELEEVVNVKLPQHPRKKEEFAHIEHLGTFFFFLWMWESSASVKTHKTAPALEGNRRTGRSSFNEEVSDDQHGRFG